MLFPWSEVRWRRMINSLQKQTEGKKKEKETDGGKKEKEVSSLR